MLGSAFRLTRRELEVLKLICEGYSTKEIASQLAISVKTAMCHRSHVLEKSQVRNAVQLYPWALEHGLLQQDSSSVSDPQTTRAASDEVTVPSPQTPIPAPLESPRASKAELLANEEYARVLYEKFKLKIEARSRAGSVSFKPAESRERIKWLKTAASNALAIYRSAKKARVDFEADYHTARADVGRSRIAS